MTAMIDEDELQRSSPTITAHHQSASAKTIACTFYWSGETALDGRNMRGQYDKPLDKLTSCCELFSIKPAAFTPLIAHAER
jgi:hypothetical protein